VGSIGPILAILVLLGLGYALLALPHRRRQRAHQAMQDAVVVGDEIITAGGMHGVVRADDGEELRIEIAPGVVVRLDRRAVAAVAVELPTEDELEQAADGEGLPSGGQVEPPAEGEAPAQEAATPGGRANDGQ
jgi:preprotein translocase subunit YajC